MADALDSKSSTRKGVEVQVLSPVLLFSHRVISRGRRFDDARCTRGQHRFCVAIASQICSSIGHSIFRTRF
jgi:hypothetical protein